MTISIAGPARGRFQSAATKLEQRHPLTARLVRLLGRKARLHWVLFMALTVIATVPVGILAVWVEQSAYQKELDSVRERHLLIARNLSHTLGRYTTDLAAVFETATAQADAGAPGESLTSLLSTLHFEHVCILGSDDLVERFVPGLSGRGGRKLPADRSVLRSIAKTGETVFSGVMASAAGTPTIYLVRGLGDGRIAIGAVNTDYIVQLQKAIAFGDRGHAAIVDHQGKVLAHPNAQWRKDMQDLSKVYAVRQMISGETGVTTFFSPAMKADMIAGYTSVPGVGWGVMVPQPLSELAVRAHDIEAFAVRIAAIGLLIAVILSWMLARHLASPIERVAQTARDIAGGRLEARVTGLPRTLPCEIEELASAFNFMVGQLCIKNAELAATAIRAESANRAKTQFMANMSHEFRTPLNAIIGFTEVMRDRIFGPLGNEKYAGYVGDIHNSATHLGSMIKEILDLTKAEQGRMELDLGPVAMPEILDLTLRMVRQRAEEKQIVLHTAYEGDLPELWSDAVKMRQILLNLLSNAVKFTPPNGTITIHVGAAERNQVRLSVADTGIGIAEKDMAKVMEPFGQVANAFSRNHEGSGLGLPLTKELVDLLGGRMEMASEVGRGTTVTVWLPLRSELPEAA